MKLSDLIKKYRSENGISQRRFSIIAGLASSTISLIESGINPRTGLPYEFQLETYNAIANALHMSLQDLFSQIEDAPSSIKLPSTSSDTCSLSPQESALLLYFRSMSPEGRTLLIRSAEAFSAAYPAASEKKLG